MFKRLLKRIGIIECVDENGNYHDERVRTCGKMVTCSICNNLVLMATYSASEPEDGWVTLTKVDDPQN